MMLFTVEPRCLLSFECELADADEVLCDLGEPLFTFVSYETRPVDQVLIDLLQRLLIVLTELHLGHKTSR